MPDALQVLIDAFNEYGLGSIAASAWQQFTTGQLTDDQVIQWMRSTPEYKTRFRANDVRRSLNLPPLSESEIVGYERYGMELMHMLGAPRGFYDTYDDFVDLIGKGVSMNEFTQRAQTELMRVLQAPPEVKDAYRDYFGPEGETALWMTYLDPDKALPALEQMATSALIGGTARRYGFEIGQPLASRAAEVGRTAQEAEQAFGQLAVEADFMKPTISENADLSPEAFQAALNLSPEAMRIYEKRKEDRKARFEGGGEVVTTQQGLVGVGSTR